MSRRIIIIEQDQKPPQSPCRCENCSKDFILADLLAVTDAILTPGDEVPAGRCPDCEELAYLVKEAA